MKYFIITNCPDSPQMIYAIYDSYNDALESHLYDYHGSGYVEIRKAEYSGVGPLPLIHHMKLCKKEND